MPVRMCCDETGTLELPAEVIEALAHYRRLRERKGWDWGEEDLPDLYRWARSSLFRPLLAAFADTGDWAQAARSLIAAVPIGAVAVRIDADGRLDAAAGPPRTAVPGRAATIDVVVDSALDEAARVTVAGRPVPVEARGVAIETVDLHAPGPAAAGAPLTVAFGGRAVRVGTPVRTVPAAELRLVAPRCARWSVTDLDGGAWFPDGVLRKWDVYGRAFFHGHDLALVVPAGPLRVVCTRGIEYERVEVEVAAEAGRRRTVECAPRHLHDPAAGGWYGGDLHIHLNYSGDLVCTPADAARMQLGEGLHLANLVAGNLGSSRVYDREMLERLAGLDLPWSGEDTVARMGVEYRNDLLGHVHALGPAGPPSRYHSGHAGTDHPDDWPPNAAACRELRALGATVGYAHPAFAAFPEDGSTERFFRNPRSVEARELVADAALGLVDSLDLISPFDDEGAVFLYHRLLSCGLRLAATAGTDVFLSFSHGFPSDAYGVLGVPSNPPGWGRVYAHLGDRPLSVEAFQDAVRAGRTIVTNGPWLELEVNGHGPGAVLDLAEGDRLDIRTRVRGPGARHLRIVGPDGVLAAGRAQEEVRLTAGAGEPTWIAALATGGPHPNTLDESVFAHTSPVYVDVAGRRVARAADARWCLDFLERLEDLVRRHGHFAPEHRDTQLNDVIDVLDQARSFYRDVAATENAPQTRRA
jgi:hypothetical protein